MTACRLEKLLVFWTLMLFSILVQEMVQISVQRFFRWVVNSSSPTWWDWFLWIWIKQQKISIFCWFLAILKRRKLKCTNLNCFDEIMENISCRNVHKFLWHFTSSTLLKIGSEDLSFKRKYNLEWGFGISYSLKGRRRKSQTVTSDRVQSIYTIQFIFLW